MMNPRAIREMLRRSPFQPLEFKVTDGTSEIVKHPDNAILTASEVGIGQFDRDSADFPDWLKTYALVHLVSVEAAHSQPSSN